MEEDHRRPYKRPVEFKIMCPECGEVHHHKCNDASETKLHQAFLEFLTWVPEFGLYEKVQKAMQKAGEEEGWLEKGQDFTKSPFFGAQPWTYALGDKHFGREFSGVISRIIEAAGFDPHELRQAAFQKLEQEEAEKKVREDRQKNIRGQREEAIKLFRSKAPLDEKIAVLDKIIADRTRGLRPTEYVNKAENQIEDTWKYETLRMLKDRYGGGISPEVNELRIEAARKIALDEGIYTVAFFGADGKSVFVRRFQEREEAMKLVKEESFVAYDGLSEEPFACAVYLTLKTRGVLRGEQGTVNYVRGPKGWVVRPSKEG